MSGNSLEPGLDALHGAPGAAGLALQEEEPGLFLQDGVGRAAGVARHVLLCKREGTGMSMYSKIVVSCPDHMQRWQESFKVCSCYLGLATSCHILAILVRSCRIFPVDSVGNPIFSTLQTSLVSIAAVEKFHGCEKNCVEGLGSRLPRNRVDVNKGLIPRHSFPGTHSQALSNDATSKVPGNEANKNSLLSCDACHRAYHSISRILRSLF